MNSGLEKNLLMPVLSDTEQIANGRSGDPLQEVLSRLEKVTGSNGQYMARCPCHDDNRNSLCVGTGEDDRVLLKCQAGCNNNDIVNALGLEWKDLRPSNFNGKTKTVAVYRYEDEDGNLLYEVHRNEQKRFFQCRPDEKGGRIWNLDGVARVPYRLPELVAADPRQTIFICEGEKDCDRLQSLGMLATCNSGGAGNWQNEFSRYFTGRRVVIIPDNDDPGRDHAQKVAQSLHGVAESVRILELPNLPEKGDVSDWIDAVGTKGDLLDFAESASPLSPATQSQKGANPVQIQIPEIIPYLPFPTEAFPEPVSSFICNGSSVIGCDKAMVGLPTLSTLAAAIGNTRKILLKNGWSEPVTTWTGVIVESGGHKSPAFDRAARILRERQEAAFREFGEKMEEYQRELLEYQADLMEWKKTGRKDGEPPPEEPNEPVPWRIVVVDTTVEALVPLLRSQPRGLLLIRDELSGWLNGLDQYKGGKGSDVAYFLEMQRAGLLIVDRKTGNQTIVVPRASLCITGCIQPGVLRRAVGTEYLENGLCARLLMARPPQLQKRWNENETDPHIESKMEGLFDRLLQLKFNVDQSGELAPVAVPLSADGKKAWIAFYNEHAAEQAEIKNPHLKAAWSKLEGYAARISLVIHCIRVATGEQLQSVDSRSVASAIEIVRWFCNEARRIYAELSDTESERETRQVIEIIEQAGGAITVNHLRAKSRLFDTNEEAEITLSELVEAEVGFWENAPAGPHGGRPTRLFRLKNSRHQNRNPSFSRETGGFGYGYEPESPDISYPDEQFVEIAACETSDFGEV